MKKTGNANGDRPEEAHEAEGYHRPVLVKEVLEGLRIKPDGVFVDCTFGGGGHSRQILASLGETLDDLLKDPECESLATELSLLDQHFDDMAAHIRDCFNRVERKRREARLQSLITELKVAEHDKRDEEVHRLNMQINELRMRKAGASSPGPSPAAKE